MKSVAILSHDSVAHELGPLGEWLENNGFTTSRQYREDNYDRDELLAADLMIVLGSPGSVATGFCTPAGEAEIELIKSRLDSGKPYLGICYGSQALATALGGEVVRMPEPIVGYSDVNLSASDQNLEAGPWAVWHEDGIKPESLSKNPDVEVLATLKDAVEVFRSGKAWGIQFHPEVDGEILGRMASSLGVAEEQWSPFAEAMTRDGDVAAKRSSELFDAFWNDVTSAE